MSLIGVTRNPYERTVPERILAAAAERGLAVRLIDLPTVRTEVSAAGTIAVFDQSGPITGITGLTPFLLYGFPAAVHGYRILTQTARSQNTVDGVLRADDKATTALLLASAGVPQVPTEVVPQSLDEVTAAAKRIGYPVVVKRTHGAQGRWVRRATDPETLATALAELAVEGPGAIVVQPEVVESRGRSIRALVTGGRLLVATERVAPPSEWKSNVSRGARQRRTDLTEAERSLVHRAAEALELRHAGVDLLRTNAGPVVLEVNACPAFTSMQPYCEVDIAAEVLRIAASD
ncbi:MAG TPA: RimK family alpha-L-glutamate ligase [Micromonosporaceae bacterium]|nr:RimK family alpha-L-glutamate ligase [Micromonosporaceae bacterium]